MPTLLIVDDQESVLNALEFVFVHRGFRTLVARSGAAALGLASTEHFDASLLDLHMPEMDGITLCNALRTSGHGGQLWIMTAACTREAEVKAQEAGAIAVLRKPFNIEEFIHTLEARLTPANGTAPANSTVTSPSSA